MTLDLAAVFDAGTLLTRALSLCPRYETLSIFQPKDTAPDTHVPILQVEQHLQESEVRCQRGTIAKKCRIFNLAAMRLQAWHLRDPPIPD